MRTFEFQPCSPAALNDMLEHRPGRAIAEVFMREMREHCLRNGYPVTTVINVSGPLNDFTETQARKCIAESWRASTLKVVIDSPGGSCSVGNRIASDLEELKRARVRLETHALRDCHSAANAIYIRGHQRTACHNSRFTLHRAAVDIDAVSRVSAPILQKAAGKMEEFDRHFLARLDRARVRLTGDMLDAFKSGHDVRLDANDAVAVGLVHFLTDIAR